MVRAALDRILYVIAWLAGRGLFRTVEVVGAERIPHEKPVLLVANHFNGAIDAVMLVMAVSRVPRFVAKATLWRSPLARPFLWFAGLVPVHRPEDQPDGASGRGNEAAFARATDVLRRRGMLAIFPEGTTHDRLELARLRTGAGRIVLGAREEGVRDIIVVPIGITYDAKLALRSRALVRVGEPIDLDARLDEIVPAGEAIDDENRDAVRRFTTLMEQRLRAVTPQYSSPLHRAVLGIAAEVRLRSDVPAPGALVPLARRETMAQQLAAVPPAVGQHVVDALGIYNLYLDVYRLRDEQLEPRVRRRWLLWRALKLTLYLAALGVLMIVGAAVNVLPTLAVASAGRRPLAPVSKGTVRVLVAVVTFLPVWILGAIYVPVTGVWPTLGWLALWPIAGAIALGGIERSVRLAQAWTGWLGLRNARGDLDDLLESRRIVCRAVDEALLVAEPDQSVSAR